MGWGFGNDRRNVILPQLHFDRFGPAQSTVRPDVALACGMGSRWTDRLVRASVGL
jgi:hypothetical protein